jgi:hypothetical protein
MQEIRNIRRRASLTVTPQALAWDGNSLWLSSRDLGTLYKVDPEHWKIVEELDPPGIVWAAVFTNDGWRITLGKGLNDDRYIYRYTATEGFKKLFACPDFTGSYLSFDGENCYLSQWYKGQIHQFEDSGKILRTLELGEEICGHTFVDGTLYVLRGREHKDVPNKTEEWRIARLNMHADAARLEELAPIPFAARSLTFDGEKFWSNHRAANETISFTLPS